MYFTSQFTFEFVFQTNVQNYRWTGNANWERMMLCQEHMLKSNASDGGNVRLWLFCSLFRVVILNGQIFKNNTIVRLSVKAS